MESVFPDSWPTIYKAADRIVLAIDESGNIVRRGSSFRDLPADDIASIGRSFSFHDPTVNSKLSRLIEACVNYDESHPMALPAPITVSSPNGNSFNIDAIPVPAIFSEVCGGIKIALLIRLVDSSLKTRKKNLCENLGLTPSEAELAIILAEGGSLKDAARQQCTSIWTERAHLRAIFQKTETHRQGELVAKLLNFEL